MLSSEIIQQLEEFSLSPTTFPYFQVFFPIDARMSIYGNGLDWAIVMEMLFFNPGPAHHDCFGVELYCYGSDLPSPPGYPISYLNVTRDGPRQPLFDPDDILGHRISSRAGDMIVRDKIIPISTNPLDYKRSGINLKKPPEILGYELLRLIVPKYRKLFLVTESEIASQIGGSMPLLLRLDEWRHPDREKNESPAYNETFQMIADVIAKNDPSLYRPTESPNTHWSNWPDAGML